MEAVLYAATTGALVLVPDCFKPSRDMEQAHGRFRVCGRISIEHLDSPLWRRILADFENAGHAVLGPADADRLFGAEALWGFSDRRSTPREMKMSYAQVRQRVIRWTRVREDEPSAPAVATARSGSDQRPAVVVGTPQQVRKRIDTVGDAVAGVGDRKRRRLLSPTTG
jgi:hypothetical protein